MPIDPMFAGPAVDPRGVLHLDATIVGASGTRYMVQVELCRDDGAVGGSGRKHARPDGVVEGAAWALVEVNTWPAEAGHGVIADPLNPGPDPLATVDLRNMPDDDRQLVGTVIVALVEALRAVLASGASS